RGLHAFPTRRSSDLGAMEQRTLVRTVAPGTRVTIGFDGSLARDTTAIVGCTLDSIPHLFVIGCWEKPATAGPEWRVPVLEVEERSEEHTSELQSLRH